MWLYTTYHNDICIGWLLNIGIEICDLKKQAIVHDLF